MISEGNTPEVIDVGVYNDADAGPDFREVKIKIGEWTWVGNAEIHLKSSDFVRHNHHKDPAYTSNLILHIVLENDREIPFEPNREPLCCIISFDEEALNKVKSMTFPAPFPCGNALAQLPTKARQYFLDALFEERMQEKLEQIERVYLSSQKDILSTLYILLVRYMGSKVNNDIFEQIARSLPLSIIYKHTDSQLQLEALFLGQAGLLDSEKRASISDPYVEELTREYLFLRAKYSLSPITPPLIKRLRLRPASFPDRRLAILAALYHKISFAANELLFSSSFKELQTTLRPPLSDYWKHHYCLGKEDKKNTISGISKATTEAIIINVIVPIRLFLSKREDSSFSCTQNYFSLKDLPSERNKIVSLYTTMGIRPTSAQDTQALLQLYNKYCLPQKCSKCLLGYSHLST